LESFQRSKGRQKSTSKKAASENPELAAALGSDYTITPDIIVVRNPEKDSVINAPR
jgi:hypothetical protein